MYVRSLPWFSTQKRFTTALFGTFVFDIFSKIGTNKTISSSHVELMEQKRDCPICILTVHDAKNGLTTAIRLKGYQIVTEYMGE